MGWGDAQPPLSGTIALESGAVPAPQRHKTTLLPDVQAPNRLLTILWLWLELGHPHERRGRISDGTK